MSPAFQEETFPLIQFHLFSFTNLLEYILFTVILSCKIYQKQTNKKTNLVWKTLPINIQSACQLEPWGYTFFTSRFRHDYSFQKHGGFLNNRSLSLSKFRDLSDLRNGSVNLQILQLSMNFNELEILQT